MTQESRSIPGLRAKLDRLVYFHDKQPPTADAPHVFIYFITIRNLSDTTVTLTGRRWILHEATGHRQVIEGGGIVGQEPCLATGQTFSFNSYHVVHCNCRAKVAFHGEDANGHPVHVPMPAFELIVPSKDDPTPSP